MKLEDDSGMQLGPKGRSPCAMENLVAMGFGSAVAKQALLLCDNDLERAADALLIILAYLGTVHRLKLKTKTQDVCKTVLKVHHHERELQLLEFHQLWLPFFRSFAAGRLINSALEMARHVDGATLQILDRALWD